MTFTKFEKQFAFIFTLIFLMELICIQIENLFKWHYVTKPLIVLSLIIFFFIQSKTLQKSFRKLILLALIFSLVGDILLMFADLNPVFFMLGLVAFLLAHVMYIITFLKQKNTLQQPFTFIAILLVYASGLFYLLKGGLGAMLIPVVIYMLAILTMAATAYLRKGTVTHLSYTMVFIGAVLFMVSDSLLALNMFYKPFPFANIGIMLTYALAQFFIVIGILKQPN
jgi:uncharacterized membrane protein YhhN